MRNDGFTHYYGRHKKNDNACSEKFVIQTRNEVFSLDAYKNIDILPKCSCVYFITKNNELLYIGQTKNIYKRARVYKHYFLLDAEIVIRVKECQEKDLESTELFLIRELQPKWNISFKKKYRYNGKGRTLQFRISGDLLKEYERHQEWFDGNESEFIRDLISKGIEKLNQEEISDI